jgi:hypothetical protein
MFGLTNETPFKVSVPQFAPRPTAAQPAEDFDAMRARMLQQSAAFDKAPEVDVDADLDSWLNGINGGK